MTSFLWKGSRGYRLRPWRSPYLRWRIETYCGWKAEEIGFVDFWRFIWRQRRDLWRFLRWAARMKAAAGARSVIRTPSS
ncbi:MAG: hypothetical protein HY236_05425 [Acidobacteria bacterium]|nr:hypothetical protein [Acidobacteriota bacterium]